MDIIKNIIEDYEKLIRTKIFIPLENNEIIEFSFQSQHLPHLLGLQYLVDNPFLFEYSQGRLSATDLFKRMSSTGEDSIDTNEFENSIYFDEMYHSRIKYFCSEIIMDIIQSKQIVKFESNKIKNFNTKLDKLEYMFWKKYKNDDNRYGYFGIGFTFSGKKTDKNYPNTFFFRLDNEYICNQSIILPMSFMKINKKGNMEFEIYWKEIFESLKNNSHYKKLKKDFLTEHGELDINAIKNSDDEESKKHFELLKLDALNKAYLPYMKEGFKWTNEQKRFILKKMETKKVDCVNPNEIKMYLNEYKMKYQ